MYLKAQTISQPWNNKPLSTWTFSSMNNPICGNSGFHQQLKTCISSHHTHHFKASSHYQDFRNDLNWEIFTFLWQSSVTMFEHDLFWSNWGGGAVEWAVSERDWDTGSGGMTLRLAELRPPPPPVVPPHPASDFGNHWFHSLSLDAALRNKFHEVPERQQQTDCLIYLLYHMSDQDQLHLGSSEVAQDVWCKQRGHLQDKRVNNFNNTFHKTPQPRRLRRLQH